MFSQQKDSLKVNKLQEIVVLGKKANKQKKHTSIEAYMETSTKVNMIRRGNYAWEMSLNSMTSQRINTTIDGMQIFPACTDKMDPVTSYVEVVNMDELELNSGQKATEYGNVIGGGVNMKLKKPSYFGDGLKIDNYINYKSNSNYRSVATNIKYSLNDFFVRVNGVYKKTDNYKSGSGEEILYSQFQKTNIFLQFGYMFDENNKVEINYISDVARDVGYPSLPMDVSIAKADILSVSYFLKGEDTFFDSIETKIYANKIHHIMDDTQRPIVDIRMDMPGYSDTYGFYSKIKINRKRHKFLINTNSYYNKSFATMTMYPEDINEKDMFMFTWPVIRTFQAGVYISDNWDVNNNISLDLSLRNSLVKNNVNSEEGFNSLVIFDKNANKTRYLYLNSTSVGVLEQKENHSNYISFSYGERAPSVSEAYCFYLFNSYDGYDYIGNTNLKKEKSVDIQYKYSLKLKKYNLVFEASRFYIMDYIVGFIDENIDAMTISANGVRVYDNINFVNIYNFSLVQKLALNRFIAFDLSASYHKGIDNNDNNLPLISPFTYNMGLEISYKKTVTKIECLGNTTQNKYSSHFGENKTASYSVLNLNTSFKINTNYQVKLGIDNVLDKQYSTFSDWNNLERKGIDLYVKIKLIL